MDYIKLWVEPFMGILEPFSDGERGRLVVAMLNYARSGAIPEFRGNERFAWGGVKAIVDNEASYVEQRSSCGKLGGRPKKDEEKTLAFQEKTLAFSGKSLNETKRNETKKKRNDTETETKDTALAAVAAAWEKASCQRITERVAELLTDLVDQYPTEQVLNAIDTAVKAGVVRLSYVEGILRGNGRRQREKSTQAQPRSNALDSVLAELEEEIR